MTETSESESEVPGKPSSGTGQIDRWHWIAVGIFLVAGLLTFRDVLKTGPMTSATVASTEVLMSISKGDVIFEAWLTARNAHTLATAPQRLFDTPHCAPAEQTLTLGVPMITMGLLAIPVTLFTENPALAYNFSTFFLFVLSALAMYLLVRDWTGVPAAGIVAGLLYAFNPIRVGIFLTHPSVWDSSWLVFALFFSRRLFAHGRWRDAVGLAVACSLQIAASFYPLLAATFMAPAFAVWLLYQYRFREVRAIQIGFVVGVIGIVASLLLGPYLNAQAMGEIGGRSEFFFARWSDFLPGGQLFLGWGAIILGLIGLMVPREQVASRVGGDPRWALVIGALVTTVIAAGPFNNQIPQLIWNSPPFQIPNFYTILASFVPGLDSIRVVLRLAVAALVVVSILAGFGTAWLIARWGNRERIIGAVMMGLAVLSIVPEPESRGVVEVRADPLEIAFFEELEKKDNSGPILEIPLMTGIARSLHAPKRILLSAYHHRRISTCFGSFRASDREKLGKLVEQLPETKAIRGLRNLGFTTLVVNKSAVWFAFTLRQKINGGARERLPLLFENEKLAAYDLLQH